MAPENFEIGQRGRRFGKLRPAPATKRYAILDPSDFDQPFQDLPAPTGSPPYHLDLADVVSSEVMNDIKAKKKLVFHLTGDVGAVGNPVPNPQRRVAMAMEEDCYNADIDPKPSFLYIVGDIVYFFGEAKEYYPQFYQPYENYPPPIFAIPGNHDGYVLKNSSVPSLKAFMDNFCAPRPVLAVESVDTGRTAMTQPNCYWTLLTPYVSLVGIYTNVVSDGELRDDQIEWLHNELTTHKEKEEKQGKHLPLILAMHRPAVSFGGHIGWHSGSAYIDRLLNSAIVDSGRLPDMVVAGHSHNYQRFTRTWKDGSQVPYIVAGAGGFPLLYDIPDPKSPTKDISPKLLPLKSDDSDPEGFTETTLNNYVDDRYGYLLLTVTAPPKKNNKDKFELRGDYITVSTEDDKVITKDRFILDLAHRKVTTLNPTTDHSSANSS